MEAMGETDFFRSADKEARSEQAAEEKLRLAKKRAAEQKDFVHKAQLFKHASQANFNERFADEKAAEQNVESVQQELGHAQGAMKDSRMSLERALGKIPSIKEQIEKAKTDEEAARLDLELAKAQAANTR